MRDRKPIISQEGEITFPVPEHLKPNLRIFNFAFFPHGHRLFFQTKTSPLGILKSNKISPSIFSGALYRLFNSTELVEKYGEINIYPEKQTELIDEILRLQNLTKLDIAITLPNDDDLSSHQKRIVERYRKEGVKNSQYILTGYKENGLKPEIETQAMMQLANSNGKITATGYRGEEKITISTDKYPVIIRDIYSPKTETTLQALARIAKREIARFTGK
jgi:hypothetical protein